MTVATEYYNWQQHAPAPDPQYTSCSPNIVAIYEFMAKRWGCTDIGCYGWRPVRGGTAPSSHGFGAARDIRYDHVGRVVALSEIAPWLIDNSAELHVSAIHDYVGCRIWHADRQAWKAQTPSSQGGSSGMGEAWATYFHIETPPSGWHDGTPVDNRTTAPPAPTPLPGGFVHKTIRLGDENADVYAMQMFCKKYAGNTDIAIDGKFGSITQDAIKKVQTWWNIQPVDGIAGPITWAKVDQIANTS